MSNPKDLVGARKAQLGLVPPALEIGASEAMADGASKYGPFNWRTIPIEYMTYLTAMKRHIQALIDGQDLAADTGIHHLKHIVAGGGILLDALNIPGCLVDDRPPKGPAAEMLAALDKTRPPRTDAYESQLPPMPPGTTMSPEYWGLPSPAEAVHESLLWQAGSARALAVERDPDPTVAVSAVTYTSPPYPNGLSEPEAPRYYPDALDCICPTGCACTCCWKCKRRA